MECEPKTFKIVSLGCPKNLVDSEVMAGSLMAGGWIMVPDGPSQVCIVNTCAFVTDAAEESVQILLEQAEAKANGLHQFLIVTGCLPEKYARQVHKAVEEVDVEIGTEDFVRIGQILEDLEAGNHQRAYLSTKQYLYDETTPRVISGPAWRAYLKLAEGCDNACAYCLIGSLRGPYRSRSQASVIAEAYNMADLGVRELILVAQDVTHYGADRGDGANLAGLLPELDRIESLRWIRLLYAHPAHLTRPMLEAMAQAQRLVPYLDLPLQHASDPILKRMNRKVDLAHIETILNQARKIVPGLVLRTTFILGLPGETEDDFHRLMDFVQRQRFAQVGVFVYSPEEGTPAFAMDGQVPPEIAQARADALMERQQAIAAEFWRGFLGQTVDVLIEEKLHVQKAQDFTHAGRFYGQAPEIDGITFCRLPSDASPGSFVPVRISDATAYDLMGQAEK